MAKLTEVWAAQAKAMSEKTLDLKVRRLLNQFGLAPFAFHPPDGTGGMRAGFPDWTIMGAWVMFRELKTEEGVLSPAQKAVIAQLESIGADVDVWRPRDLFSGRIAAELAAVADSATRARAAELDELMRRRRAAEKAKREAAGRVRPGGNVRQRRRAA